jgi:hypothetical protein
MTIRDPKSKNVFFKIQSWKKNLPNVVVAGMNNVVKVTLSKDKNPKKEGEFLYELLV